MCLAPKRYFSKAKTLQNCVFHRRKDSFPYLDLDCALFGYYRWRCVYVLLCGVMHRDSGAEPLKLQERYAHLIFLWDFEVSWTRSSVAQSGLWIHPLRFHNPDCADTRFYVVIVLRGERGWSSG